MAQIFIAGHLAESAPKISKVKWIQMSCNSNDRHIYQLACIQSNAIILTAVRC